MSDDFYVGYEPEMPAGLAPRIRAAVSALLALSVVTALGLAAAQQRFSDAAFEFGRERAVEGLLIERPYPMLVTPSGSYLLVGPGKRGAASVVAGLDGRKVRVRGSLIQRDADRMLQVSIGAVEALEPAASVIPPPLEPRGLETLDGEIVDGKCHVGVMKPGEGPLHRDCAVRCLLGGVPPLLVVAGADRARRITLVTVDGGALGVDLEPWAGRPVRVEGVVYARGDERYFGIDPRRIAVH